MAATDQVSRAMDSSYATICKKLGACLAETRKAQGMTQMELAQHLGVAADPRPLRSRTCASARPPHHRHGQDAQLLARRHAPGRLAGRAKRGPASRFERQIEALSRLPKARQKFVVDMLDAILTQQQRA